MYRVSLDNVSAQRTCSPLHEKHQATPYATFLDADETADIYSGMVMARSGEDVVSLAAGGTTIPFGLAALDRNAVINDMEGQTSVPFAVWIGGPDAFFEIMAPAFDSGQTYAVPTDGTQQLLYSNTDGELSSVASGAPVAELIEVVSSSKIIVRLIADPSAY
jgi:hypothetical protein